MFLVIVYFFRAFLFDARLSHFGSSNFASLWASSFLAFTVSGSMTQPAQVTLQPGTLGLTWDTSTFVIDEVDEDGSAHKAGVQPGWKFEMIDGETFNDELLQAKKTGPEAYNVTFSIPKEQMVITLYSTA